MTTTKTIQAAATAIASRVEGDPGNWPNYIDAARDALEAIRDPSDEMVAAVAGDASSGAAAMRRKFGMMIDAAIGPAMVSR